MNTTLTPLEVKKDTTDWSRVRGVQVPEVKDMGIMDLTFDMNSLRQALNFFTKPREKFSKNSAKSDQIGSQSYKRGVFGRRRKPYPLRRVHRGKWIPYFTLPKYLRTTLRPTMIYPKTPPVNSKPSSR